MNSLNLKKIMDKIGEKEDQNGIIEIKLTKMDLETTDSSKLTTINLINTIIYKM